jgi:hypothetical protein
MRMGTGFRPISGGFRAAGSRHLTCAGACVGRVREPFTGTLGEPGWLPTKLSVVDASR